MLKVGILGGGQLGRMLLQAAANYTVETSVMENDPHCPAAHLCHHFIQGDIRKFEDVYNFGKGLDAITIEIESVNEDALQRLKEEGVKIFPDPSALRVIKNKIAQKAVLQRTANTYGSLLHHTKQKRSSYASQFFACRT
jgi:5-(carboxyamino)imidazole ribonucleotide synthase